MSLLTKHSKFADLAERSKRRAPLEDGAADGSEVAEEGNEDALEAGAAESADGTTDAPAAAEAPKKKLLRVRKSDVAGGDTERR